MESVDAVVIGAGVVGLAIARELALQGRETLILEAAPAVGTGASSRNSEVIHAGIYYAPGSLKARLCVAGRERLYHFCAERGIAHRQLGKLIVADRTELPVLQQLALNARSNGVELEWLDAGAVRALEPALSCAAALHSPLSGILDAHGLMLALLADAEAHGATLSGRSTVTRLIAEERGIEVRPPFPGICILQNCSPGCEIRQIDRRGGARGPGEGIVVRVGQADGKAGYKTRNPGDGPP